MRLEYSGMSYQQASREGERLLHEAIKTGRWFELPERLSELRAIMHRADSKQEKLKLG
jgi:hypothetical protein